MGCEDLYSLVEAEPTSIREYSGEKLAIDASFWFERYYFAVVRDGFSLKERTANGECDISQALSLLSSLPDLLRHNITPLFVFDPIRRSRSSTADTAVPYLQDTPDLSEPENHTAFLQRPTEILLNFLDVPYCESPLYAEADASVYAREGRVDSVVSRDYDAVLYGSPHVVRKPYDSNWEKIELESLLDNHQLNMRELLDVAILTGTDEVAGPYKENISEAVDLVKNTEDLGSLESEYENVLRGPSLSATDPAPTFDQLHKHYLEPPVIPYPARPNVSHPEPDYQKSGRFIHNYLSKKPSIVEQLLDPIKESI